MGYELTGVGLLWTSALGLNLLWPNHPIYRLRSWSTQIKVMASCMMAPSHYLKQCGLIIKLINKVPWHLCQWIIIKDLKIPISKMRLKLVLWDNFTSSPEIIHFFYSAVIIVLFCVMVVSWYLLSPSLILLTAVYSRGTRNPPHMSFVTTLQGAMFQELKTTLLQEESVTWTIMTSIKAKIWKLLVN